MIKIYLKKNNKFYSPKYCCFLPQKINLAIINRSNFRGKYPIGVTEQNGKYKSSISINSKKIFLGYFNSSEMAFEVYKKEKIKYLKTLANKYKKELNINTYNSIINYKISKND